jgi:hypothetical protein
LQYKVTRLTRMLPEDAAPPGRVPAVLKLFEVICTAVELCTAK